MNRLLRQAPGGSGAITAELLQCGDGNTIGTYAGSTFYGLKAGTPPIEELPTAAPDASGAAAGTYVDGLSWARRWVNNSMVGFVWISNSIRIDTTGNGTPDTDISDLYVTIPEDAFFTSRASYRLPVSGGGTALVYIPWLT